eukprot:347660-Chlamydomonas_euryale.AAC.1
MKHRAKRMVKESLTLPQNQTRQGPGFGAVLAIPYAALMQSVGALASLLCVRTERVWPARCVHHNHKHDTGAKTDRT